MQLALVTNLANLIAKFLIIEILGPLGIWQCFLLLYLYICHHDDLQVDIVPNSRNATSMEYGACAVPFQCEGKCEDYKIGILDIH